MSWRVAASCESRVASGCQLPGALVAHNSRLATRNYPQGQATVEFALVFLVLVAMLYGILEISRLLFVNAELENATREASHYASLHPETTATYLRANVIGPKLSLIDKNSPDFAVGAPTFPLGGTGPYYPVQINLTYTWTSMVNIMPDMTNWRLNPLGPLLLTSSSTSLIEGR